MKIIYINIVFLAFSIFFVSPILSPSVNDLTIYLFWFIPFFDLYFDSYLILLIKKKFSLWVFVLICVYLLISLIRGNIIITLKIISIVFSICYLSYVYKNIGFKLLYYAFNINIYIALLQFIFYLIDPSLAYLIGPTNISHLIWGNYSTITYTNFYSIFWLPRTCGLSREAGFFASLLSVIWILYIGDNLVKRKQKTQHLLFLIGYICSFSKMSILFPAMLIVYWLRKRIDKLPFYVSFTIIFVVLSTVANILLNFEFFTIESETWAHRFSGYCVTMHMNLSEVLLGCKNGILGLNHIAISKFPMYNYIFIDRGLDLCGYPQIIIEFGYIGLIIYLAALKSLNMRSSGLIFLLIATFNVNLFTSTSFVVIAYWISLYFMDNENTNIIKFNKAINL